MRTTLSIGKNKTAFLQRDAQVEVPPTAAAPKEKQAALLKTLVAKLGSIEAAKAFLLSQKKTD